MILEAFIIMPPLMPLNSILGSQKMPLNVDIKRHFEKNASKDLLLPYFRWHFKKMS